MYFNVRAQVLRTVAHLYDLLAHWRTKEVVKEISYMWDFKR